MAIKLESKSGELLARLEKIENHIVEIKQMIANSIEPTDDDLRRMHRAAREFVAMCENIKGGVGWKETAVEFTRKDRKHRRGY
jgi:t-SNARE complex subunit (syntaxin)